MKGTGKMALKKDTANLKFETRSVHAGVEPDPTTGAVTMPLHQSCAFVFKDSENAANIFTLKEEGYIYSRATNPTVAALEERLAALEGGTAATCASSGHAAQLMTFFTLLSPGDEYIASKKLYGGSVSQTKNTFPRGFGWKGHLINPDDLDEIKANINEKTKFIFMESLANPGGVIIDMEAIAKIAEDAGIPLIIDNTMASPYLCRPLEWGANIVTHSTTKFLCGHGVAMGGAVVDGGNFDWLAHADKFPTLTGDECRYPGLNFAETFGDKAFAMHNHGVGLCDLGMCQQPMNAWLTLMGTETLPLRMERHCQNAQKAAEFLDDHDAVSWVNYAGLKNSPYYDNHKKYMPKGAGSVFTFGLKGGHEACKKLVENVKLFSHLANLGDTRSLIIHPSSTTHSQLSEEHKVEAHAGPDLVRVSIGIENVDDIIDDLKQGLALV